MVNLSQTLRELEIEDFIWIIYAFIVIGALASDYFERQWLINKDTNARKTFKTINIIIFIVTFIIYFYFVTLTYKRLKEQNPNLTMKDMFLKEANFIAALLFLIGGGIYLFTEIASDTVLTSPQQII